MGYESRTVGEFLDGIASESVTPAGGSAAGVVGALGTALCEMVCIHTLAREDHAAVAAEMADVRVDLKRRRDQLLDLAATDAAVVAAAFGTGSGEPDEADFKRATGVPLTTATACLDVLELARAVVREGTATAVVDAGTGVFLVHSALRASVFTARRNLQRVSEPAFVAEIERRSAETERAAAAAREAVLETIETRV